MTGGLMNLISPRLILTQITKVSYVYLSYIGVPGFINNEHLLLQEHDALPFCA